MPQSNSEPKAWIDKYGVLHAIPQEFEETEIQYLGGYVKKLRWKKQAE